MTQNASVYEVVDIENGDVLGQFDGLPAAEAALREHVAANASNDPWVATRVAVLELDPRQSTRIRALRLDLDTNVVAPVGAEWSGADWRPAVGSVARVVTSRRLRHVFIGGGIAAIVAIVGFAVFVVIHSIGDSGGPARHVQAGPDVPADEALPIPLLVLGGLALILILGGILGFFARRMQARRMRVHLSEALRDRAQHAGP